MADDRMRNDDLDRNMGAGQKDNKGSQSPGRNQQDDMSTGQHKTGQQSEPGHIKDDFGTSGSKVGQGGQKGGQNR